MLPWLCALAACAPASSPANWLGPVAVIANPAPIGSRYPRLTSGPDGALVMSWLAPAGTGHQLQYSRWHEGGFDAPATVAEGEDWFVNWADFPAVVPGPGGLLAAHWLRKLPGHAYAYEVRLAISSDRGLHWSEPRTPHDDGTATEHGFVSLLPHEGGVLAAWLDGRHTSGDHDHESAEDGAMTLRTLQHARDGSATGPGVELDARVCDCCQTGAAMTSDGPVIVYRDRSGDEVRDISIVRWTPGGWSAPAPVHADGWHMPACPVNGPSVDARDRQVVVAWFTAPDRARVRVAFSRDGGASFGPALEVASGTPIGRVDVALLPDGRAAVAWLDRDDSGTRVLVQPWTPDGAAGAAQVVAASSGARSTGFPQLAVAGNRLLFAWTDDADPSSVRTAAAQLR